MNRIRNLYDNDYTDGDMVHEYNHINQNHLYSQCNRPNTEDDCIVTQSDSSLYERTDATCEANNNQDLNNVHFHLESHTDTSEPVNETCKIDSERQHQEEHLSTIGNKLSEYDTATPLTHEFSHDKRNIKGELLESNRMLAETQDSSFQLPTSIVWNDNARCESYNDYSENELAER